MYCSRGMLFYVFVLIYPFFIHSVNIEYLQYQLLCKVRYWECVRTMWPLPSWSLDKSTCACVVCICMHLYFAFYLKYLLWNLLFRFFIIIIIFCVPFLSFCCISVFNAFLLSAVIFPLEPLNLLSLSFVVYKHHMVGVDMIK